VRLSSQNTMGKSYDAEILKISSELTISMKY